MNIVMTSLGGSFWRNGKPKQIISANLDAGFQHSLARIAFDALM
jgi:hypothetical protein